MSELISLASLFLAAFAAATIFPLQSEAVLIGLLLQGEHAAWLLVVVASLGNTLGSIVNWLLGRSIEHFHDKRWFPVKQHDLERAQSWYKRHGRWSLLLSWVPFIGDPLAVAAGIMRENFFIFTALVAVAKTGRYAVIAFGLTY